MVKICFFYSVTICSFNNGLILQFLLSLNNFLSVPVPQAAAELCGDATPCECPLRPQTHASSRAAGLRQSWNLQPAAEWGAAGEDHQTGQTHLLTQQVDVALLLLFCLRTDGIIKTTAHGGSGYCITRFKDSKHSTVLVNVTARNTVWIQMEVKGLLSHCLQWE